MERNREVDLHKILGMEGEGVNKDAWIFLLRTGPFIIQSCCSGPRGPTSWAVANRWGLEGLQMTLGKLQLVADAAEAGGHLCSGAHATHLARLHVLSPPIKSSKPRGLQIKF